MEANIVVIGHDFRTASSIWRSKLVREAEVQTTFFQGLINSGLIDGALALNTCNRNEWIVSAENPDWAAEILKAQMLNFLQEAGSETGDAPIPYAITGENAVRYVIEVASGLRSFMVGEIEIFNQVKNAFELSRKQGFLDRRLNGLQAALVRAVGELRRLLLPVAKARGIGHLAVDRLKKRLPPGEAAVAVVGYGVIGQKVYRLLAEQSGYRITIYNRTLRPGFEHVRPLTELAAQLADFDAAIVCTGSLSPVITMKMIGDNRRKKMLLVDIGIPRQVQAECGSLDSVELHSLDSMIDSESGVTGVSFDRQAIESAIDREVACYDSFCRAESVSPVLGAADDLRRRVSYQVIPEVVDSQFGELDETGKKKIEETFRKFFGRFSHEMMTVIRDQNSE
jgi:glutamyl-tRNA reductase